MMWDRMMRGVDHEHFPEIGRQVGVRTQVIDDLADLPMLGHRDQVALHQPAGGFFGVSERFFDGGPVVGLHRPQHRSLLVLLEVLEDRDRVIGFQVAGDPRQLIRAERVEQGLADVLVHLGEHVGIDDSGERFDQPVALVAGGELDQVGDVGRMERGDHFAGAFVIARFDGVEDIIHELRPQPVFVVDCRGCARVQATCFGGGGDFVAFGHCPPLPDARRPPIVRRTLVQAPWRA